MKSIVNQEKKLFWQTLGLLLLWVFIGVPVFAWVYMFPVNLILGLIGRFLGTILAKIAFVACLVSLVVPFLGVCYYYPYAIIQGMGFSVGQKRFFAILLSVLFLGTLVNFLIVPLLQRFGH